MRTTVRRKRGEAAVAFSLLALSVYVGVTAAALPFGSLSDPGAGFFPLSVAVLLGGVSVGLAVQAFVASDPAAPGVDPGVAPGVDLGGAHVLAVVAGLAGLLLAWKPLGFMLGAMLFLALMFRVLAGLAWWRAALSGAVAGLALWAVFTLALGVRLPGGWLA